MPKASKDTATDTVRVEGYEGAMERLEGGYTVAFETYTQDADLAPFFAGLPDDRCQSPHWGYVVKGKVTFTYGDREETFEEGARLLRAPWPHPAALRGHPDRGVQPDRGAAADDRRGDAEHAGRRGLTVGPYTRSAALGSTHRIEGSVGHVTKSAAETGVRMPLSGDFVTREGARGANRCSLAG